MDERAELPPATEQTGTAEATIGFTPRRLAEFAFELAGVATGPLLRDNPGYVFPSEEVSRGVRAYVREKTGFDVATLPGYSVPDEEDKAEARARLLADTPNRFGRIDPKGDPAPAGEDYLQVESVQPFASGQIVMNTRTEELVRVREVQDEDAAPALFADRGIGSEAQPMLPGDELLVLATTTTNPEEDK